MRPVGLALAALAPLQNDNPVTDHSPSPSSISSITQLQGYLNKESYVKAAREMPAMNHQQIDDEWRRLGLADRGGQGPYVHGTEVLPNV